MFIDDIEVEVIAGDGGSGAISFRREKFVPRGGPDGGDGGRGGSIIVRADGALRTLNHLAGLKRIIAPRGGDGGPKKKTGAAGKDVVIPVPVGTVVIREGAPIGELTADGQEIVVARGGRGGRGNVRFATATLQAPRYAEKGGAGERVVVRLTLKIIADAALVGKPNAGKSALLGALSSANPKVAPYPFTTLAPQLGIVSLSHSRSVIIVEVPGLIEGAAAGRGLGHEFLRHVERARVLVVVVDVTAASPGEDLDVVLGELRSYDAGLGDKVKFVLINKCDLPFVEGSCRALEDKAVALGLRAFRVSAMTGMGLEGFKRELAVLALDK